MEWYAITNIEKFDTPAVVIYQERLKRNIDKAIASVSNVKLLRPHVKTSKIAEVCKLMMERGIQKFKCATIAEAEMLGIIAANDVLLAYQPVGPKAERLRSLIEMYPTTRYSCLVDDISAAKHLSAVFSAQNQKIRIYVDLNTGMNRSGVTPAMASALIQELMQLSSIEIVGIHVYDGHIKDENIAVREQRIMSSFNEAQQVLQYLEENIDGHFSIVAGGSPSFSIHARNNVECSPGTFVFWDAGYNQLLPEEPYEFSALVVTRVVSVVNSHLITTDLGYKSVSSENPLPRVHFLNASEAVPVSQSEEHLSLAVPDAGKYKTGDVLYAVPVHICPTVALYDEVAVAKDNSITDNWKVVARQRRITC